MEKAVIVRGALLRKFLTPALCLIFLVYLYPLFYMFVHSLAGQKIGSTELSMTFENYRQILGSRGFLQYSSNSFFVLAFVLLGNVVFSLMVGYAFARYRFPFRNILFIAVLATLMIPKQTLMVPILKLMVKLGLHDTLWALIFPFCVDGFNIFLIQQYLKELPRDLEDAARVDGASEMSILWNVIFPLCKPAVALVVINTTIVTWNSFLFPLILIDSAKNRTLPLGLAMLTQGPFSTDWGTLMAGATIGSLPIIGIFLIFQRQIIEGIMSGATKD